MKAADDEIDRDFVLTDDEVKFSERMDRQSLYERKDNREKAKAKHREETNAKKRAYYQANKEKIRTQQFANYHKDRKASAAKSLYYYHKNKEEINRRRRERYAQKKLPSVCDTESN